MQEWQPKLNFPFIYQFYHPKKGFWKNNPMMSTQTLDWQQYGDELDIASPSKLLRRFYCETGFGIGSICGIWSTLWVRIPCRGLRLHASCGPTRVASSWLCFTSIGPEHPRTVQNISIPGTWYYYSMAERETSSSYCCPSSPRDSWPESRRWTSNLSTSTVLHGTGTSRSMPSTVIDDQLCEAFVRGGHSVQPQTSHWWLGASHRTEMYMQEVAPISIGSLRH